MAERGRLHDCLLLHGPDQLTAYELVEMGMAELVSRDEFGAWFRAKEMA